MSSTKIKDKGMRPKVLKRSKDCVDRLNQLTNNSLVKPDHKQYVQIKTNALDAKVVKNAHAMAFFNLTKGGLGVTYGKGTGFVIQRLGVGGLAWSAPVFFTMSQWGIGTGFGAEEIDMVMVFNDAAAVHKMIHEPSTKFGADLFVPVTSTMAPGGSGNRVYALSDSALFLDIGLTGTDIEVDQAAMDKAYGPGMDVDSVLSAGPLDELQPLYQKLYTLGLEADMEAADAHAAAARAEDEARAVQAAAVSH